MSESYYIAGIEQPVGTDSAILLHAICAEAGIKPNRVDEIHLYSDDAAALFQRRLETPQGTMIRWPHIPFLEVSGLFSICRALDCGEISTCVISEQTAQVNRAILLAGPTAIGRLNLAPRAHLSARFTYPGGISDLPSAAARVLTAIPPKEIEPDEDTESAPKPTPAVNPWLAIQSAERPDAGSWPSNRLIHGHTPLSSLDLLVKALCSSKTDPGVWISTNHGDPTASMLVLPL